MHYYSSPDPLPPTKSNNKRTNKSASSRRLGLSTGINSDIYMLVLIDLIIGQLKENDENDKKHTKRTQNMGGDITEWSANRLF